MLTEKQKHFLDRAIAIARAIAPQYALDWRIMAAAAILESGWGESQLAQFANNLFGIKAGRSTPDAQVCAIKIQGKAERFRRYQTHEEAFHAYGRLVGQSKIYAQAREIARDVALRELIARIAPVYCPDDPDYALKITQLVDLIERVATPNPPEPAPASP